MTRGINTRIGEFKKYNAQPVLLAVEKWIRILEIRQKNARYYYDRLEARGLDMDEVFDDLSIFDWWRNKLSLTQLKQMRTFLKEAIKLGYTGYVCFKVGATGCANGMWASKEPTTNGYSPKCDFIYRSFTPDYTCWEQYTKGKSLRERLGREEDIKTIREFEKILKEIA